MARLAQSQADYCAKVGCMVHSPRFAFQGGENLCGGTGHFSPRQTVNSWLGSPKHCEYLLSPRVTKSGIGIAMRNGKMFVAWAFSDKSPSYPDCPAYKKDITTFTLPNLFKIFIRRKKMSTNPVKIGVSLVLGFIGLLGIILGIHGVYVYFNRLDLFLGGEGGQLLLMLDVPIRLKGLVMWASARGLQSWFVPVLIFIGGLWLFNLSRLSYILSRFINKILP